MEERMAKNKLNIFLLIDTSKSMQGKRIKQVNQAITDIQNFLTDFQNENDQADFYVTIIPFSNSASLYNNKKEQRIDQLVFNGLKAGGWSNLHLALEELGTLLNKESKGGVMPDFGGLAPIILILSDGHPTTQKYRQTLASLEKLPWYKVALKYGIAIGLDDERTVKVLKDFTTDAGDVIMCYNTNQLNAIFQIVVVTASKVSSQSAGQSQPVDKKLVIRQIIVDNLENLKEDDWEVTW